MILECPRGRMMTIFLLCALPLFVERLQLPPVSQRFSETALIPQSVHGGIVRQEIKESSHKGNKEPLFRMLDYCQIASNVVGI
eukprot:scaffold2060_cov52-Cylindrotheca_fusiformis.AAC.1